jgi:uncharacterized membrane protein
VTVLRNILALAVVGVVAAVLASHSPALAKSYRITRVEIEARLQSDGSMVVTEDRTYSFDGSFSYAYRDMPRGQAVTFDGFEVYEGERPYHLSDSETPGTYWISSSGAGTRITWYYRAEDESRTFGFRYRAHDAVEKHEDAAVLYYKFLSEEWADPQSNVSIRLVPPEQTPGGDIKQWLHGPLWAESRTTPEGEVLAYCSRLPARAYLEIRALYPPGLFPDARASAGSVVQGIMAEEAEWAEEANRKREAAVERAEARERRHNLGKWIMIAVGLLGIYGWWQLYQNFGRRPPLPQFLDINSDVPGDTPPALVGYLLHNRQVTGAGLVGTMLDLARRGFVDLREESVEKKSFWGGMKDESEYYWDLKRAHWEKHASELREYENSLIAFIFGDLAGGQDSISLNRIKKKRTDFIKFFRKWKKGVSELGDKEEWFDKASIRGTYYSAALGAVMMLSAAGAGFIFGIWAVAMGGAGVVVLVLSFLIYHRTAKGETEARHWMALRKYLKTYGFKSMSRQDLLAKVSDYLVYGVVLGMSTKFYRELAAVIPQPEHARYVPWYVYHGTASRGFSPEAFGQAFSSMVTTTTTTMSSASGAGGGASAGGGGGASSGGGGAG